MGLFNLFKKERLDDTDYMAKADQFEKVGDFLRAIEEYQKAIDWAFKDKSPEKYKHITKKIVNCYLKLGDHDKVFEMWKLQYSPSDYGPQEMYELIKVLEAAGKNDLVLKVYDMAGRALGRNKLDFLIKQKKVPEANILVTELLSGVQDTNPAIRPLWLIKAKLCLSLKKWDEANKYLNKIIEKDPHNEEVRRLKEFCLRQVRNS